MRTIGIRVLLAIVIAFLLVSMIGCPIQPQFYTVTFDTCGGSLIDSQIVQENKKADRPAVDPVKEGYSFDNWYAESTYYTVWNFYLPITEDETLYAKWTGSTLTVGFDTQGGSAPEPIFKTVTYGQEYGELATTTRSGFAFDGWWTGINGTGYQVLSSTTVSTTSNQTLYANWKKNYPVTYHTNGATGGTSPSSQDKTHDVALTLATNSGNLVKTGYIFSGWNTEADGSGEDYTEGSSYTLNATLALYAKWTAGTFTVGFDAQEGSTPEPISKTVTYGQEYGELATTTRCGFAFDGWWTGINGTGDHVLSSTTVSITSNQTLYARWIPKYLVTFDPVGGTTPDPASKLVVYGDSYGELPVTTKEGWVFDGWWTESNDTGTLITESTIFTSKTNCTVYAKWKFAVFTGEAGGLVFFENPNYLESGWRYLEAAPSGWYDEGMRDPTIIWGPWSPNNIPLSIVTATEIGTGENNTNSIVKSTDSITAARVCSDYLIEYGGIVYDDWFLPSKEELNLLNCNLKGQELGGLSDRFYWSSSVYGTNLCVWYQEFPGGNQKYNITPNSPLSVRPIRAY